jgi:hypothetical protein
MDPNARQFQQTGRVPYQQQPLQQQPLQQQQQPGDLEQQQFKQAPLQQVPPAVQQYQQTQQTQAAAPGLPPNLPLPIQSFIQTLGMIWESKDEQLLLQNFDRLVAPGAVIHGALAFPVATPGQQQRGPVPQQQPYQQQQQVQPKQLASKIDLYGQEGFLTYWRSVHGPIPAMHLDLLSLAWQPDPGVSQTVGGTSGAVPSSGNLFAHFTKAGPLEGAYFGIQPHPQFKGKQCCNEGLVRFRMEIIPASQLGGTQQVAPGEVQEQYVARIAEEWLHWNRDEFCCCFNYQQQGTSAAAGAGVPPSGCVQQGFTNVPVQGIY